MDTGTSNAIATAHEAAHESTGRSYYCATIIFCFSTGVQYMHLKIPEMACSALTHMAVLFAVTAALEKEHQKIRPPNEQRDKRFRRHQNGGQVDQCRVWKFSLSHPGCSCREHETTEYQLRGRRTLGPGKDMTRD